MILVYYFENLYRLEPFRKCSSFISESFKNEVDPNGINWKSVSNDVRDGYFGEFKKHFYWDPSISESVVRRKWEAKAGTRYRDFISRRKASKIKPSYVPINVWESWMQLWGDAKSVERSEINSKNRCGGREVATGTHIGGSVSIGKHRKRLHNLECLHSEILELAKYVKLKFVFWECSGCDLIWVHIKTVEKGRDPTPSELHLHVHTHDHDGKSFVAERSRIIHEKYEQILREKTQSQTDIDQCETYFEVAGEEKRKKVYGLGSEAKNYYGSKFVSSGSNASSSVSPSTSQPVSITNICEFIKQLIPTLTDHILPIVLQRVHEVTSSPSTDDPLIETPIAPPATTNAAEDIDPLVSDDDHSP